MSSSDNSEKLERLIHHTLCSLPPRRAPRELQLRVLAEIGRRAAFPWWRKSFAHWPLGARAAFFVLSTGIAAYSLAGAAWVRAGVDVQKYTSELSLPLAWLESALAVFRAFVACFEIMLRNVPSLWVYGGLGLIAAMYIALFGLGAAAYRALQPRRSSTFIISAS